MCNFSRIIDVILSAFPRLNFERGRKCGNFCAGNRLAKFARTAEAKKSLPTEGEWEWGGCGDNVNFGFRKSRDFMDAPYRKRSDIKTLVKLHNNDAGRLVRVIFIFTLYAFSIYCVLLLLVINAHFIMLDGKRDTDPFVIFFILFS